MRRRWICAAALTLMASAADAFPPLRFGASTVLSGTTVAAQPQLAGTIVEDVVTPFAFRVSSDYPEDAFITMDVTGSVQSRVVHAVDGTYDFYWRIRPDPTYLWTLYQGGEILRQEMRGDGTGSLNGGPLDIAAFDIQSFFADSAAPEWRADGPGTAAPREAVIDDAGNVQFLFSEFRLIEGNEQGAIAEWWNSTLRTNEESRLFFVDTDATAYAKTATFSLHFMDGVNCCASMIYVGDSALFATFAPAIPEPKAGALLLAGLAIVAAAARRRKR